MCYFEAVRDTTPTGILVISRINDYLTSLIIAQHNIHTLPGYTKREIEINSLQLLKHVIIEI